MNYYKKLSLLLAVTYSSIGIYAQVDIAQLKKDLVYLSSDELQGRQTGSEGEKKSAYYIADRFSKLKLKKQNGSYFQNFEITQMRLATSKMQLQIGMELNGPGSHNFKPFIDYYPISPSINNDSVYGQVADVGYGLISDSLKRNDFEAFSELSGKVFFVRLGYATMEEDPHSPLSDVCSINQKIENCIKYGARAIVFIPGPKSAEKPKGTLDPFAPTKNIPILFYTAMGDRVPEHMNILIKVDIYAPKVTAYNVMGYRNNHRKKTVIIVAHHDHIGYNEYDNSRYTGTDEIHNGADDNASGVATMLQLAKILKGPKYCKNNYLFLAVSGEELGLLGSKYFAENSPINLNKVNYVINIDMFGRLDSIHPKVVINGTGTSPRWEKTIDELNLDTSKITIVSSASGVGPSDHTTFYRKGIPALHFFSGQHNDYHKPSDDEDKIDYKGMIKGIEIIQKMVKLNNKKGKLKFSKTIEETPKTTRWKVSLGIMPDYTFDGTGLRIDGVNDNKPAANAGIEAGDIIIQMGETQIINIYDYMNVLGKLKAGDILSVKLLRNGREITQQVIF